MTQPKTTTTHILALASRPEGISSRCIPALTDFFVKSAQKRAKAAGFVFPEGVCHE